MIVGPHSPGSPHTLALLAALLLAPMTTYAASALCNLWNIVQDNLQ